MKNINQEARKIIRYIFSSGSSFVLDLGLFTLFEWVLVSLMQINTTLAIVLATITARILSSIYNYLINSRLVFKHQSRRSIVLYFLLVVTQMLVSAGLVSMIESIMGGIPVLIKLFVDAAIFVVNYLLQRFVVFK